MKKLLSIFVLSLMCLATWAQKEINGIYYNLNSNPNRTAEVTNACGGSSGCSTKYTGSVKIPSYVSYNGKSYSVTSIGEYAFSGCTGLTSVTIPNSVTSIGKYAFSGCRGLTSITIPNSVTSIGDGAFARCSGLTNVTIPNSVTSIGSYSFTECTGLTSVTIPNSVTNIGHCAFNKCTGLTGGIIIPESVTSIGSDAFLNVPYIVYSGNATGSPWGAMAVCSRDPNTTTPITGQYLINGIRYYLNSDGTASVSKYSEYSGNIVIPSSITYDCTTYSVTSIEDMAFWNCTGLTSITIPNSVTSIGEYAFDGCTGLTIVTIPNSVTSIGYCAFYKCTGLTSITIPESVASIGDNAFAGCEKLKKVIWNAKKCADFKLKSPFTANSDASGTINDNNVMSFEFGNGVEHIPARLCQYLIMLTNVTIPNNVQTIGNYAFRNCTNLEIVSIGDGVTTIGDGAFYKSGIKSLTIGKNITNIGLNAFASNSKCKVIWNAKNCNDFTSTVNHPFGTIYNSQDNVYCNGTITSFEFGNEVEHIPAYLCYEFRSLTNVTIQNGVKSIGEYAFYNCESLESVNIPSSIESIGNEAFRYCKSLKSITIPDTPYGYITLGRNVFTGGGIEKVVWNVRSCNDFDYLHNPFNDGDQIKSFEFGNKVKYIPDNLCEGMKGLTSITIPSSVVRMGENTFSGCFGLNKVIWNAKKCADFESKSPFINSSIYTTSDNNIGLFEFGNEVEHIPANLCSDFIYSPESIILPASVTSIGANAFKITPKPTNARGGLNRVYCFSSLPPNVDKNSFYGRTICRLYVPANSLELYRSADVWKDFKTIMPMTATMIYTSEFGVTPYNTSADVLWPIVDTDGDVTYELILYDVESQTVVYSMTFEDEGQMMLRAPRLGERQGAGEYLNGFKYTLEYLEMGKSYSLDITVKNSTGNVIKVFTYSFTTGATAIGEVNADGVALKPRKVVEEGRVIILMPDGRKFDANGRMLK